MLLPAVVGYSCPKHIIGPQTRHTEHTAAAAKGRHKPVLFSRVLLLCLHHAYGPPAYLSNALVTFAHIDAAFPLHAYLFSHHVIL